MKVISTEKAPKALGPYSQGYVHNGILYSAGQIAINPATDTVEADTIEGQADQVCKNIGAILEEAGGQPEIPSAEIIEPDSLAKFCADVDCYKDAEHAKINTADAVCILNYSAAFLANGSASWYEVPGANQYVAYEQTDDE